MSHDRISVPGTWQMAACDSHHITISGIRFPFDRVCAQNIRAGLCTGIYYEPGLRGNEGVSECLKVDSAFMYELGSYVGYSQVCTAPGI